MHHHAQVYHASVDGGHGAAADSRMEAGSCLCIHTAYHVDGQKYAPLPRIIRAVADRSKVNGGGGGGWPSATRELSLSPSGSVDSRMMEHGAPFHRKAVHDGVVGPSTSRKLEFHGLSRTAHVATPEPSLSYFAVMVQ